MLGLIRGWASLEQIFGLSLGGAAFVWAFTTRTALLVVAYLGACFFVVALPGRDHVPIEPAAAVGFLLLCRLGFERGSVQDRSGKRVACELLLLGTVASVAATIAKGGGLAESVPWLIGPLATVALLRLDSKHLPSREALLGFVAVCVSLTLAFDLLTFSRTDASSPQHFDLGRYMGSVHDYELAGEYYAVTGLLGLSALLLTQQKWLKIVAAGNIAAASLLVFATQTRGALVLLTVGAAGILLIAFWTVRMRARAFVVIGGLTVLVATQSEQIITSHAVQRLLSSNLHEGIATGVNRERVWRNFIREPTFQTAGLFGNGLDYAYESLGTYPHSLYIWSVWSIGWVGTIVLCLALLFVLLLLGSRREGAGQGSRLMLVILGLQLIDQVKIEVGRSDTTVMFMWGMVALAIALHRAEAEVCSDPPLALVADQTRSRSPT